MFQQEQYLHEDMRFTSVGIFVIHIVSTFTFKNDRLPEMETAPLLNGSQLRALGHCLPLANVIGHNTSLTV